MPRIAFIDTETDLSGKKVLDIGGIRSDGVTFHGASISSFVDFLHGSDFACGHNILNHDLKYVGTWLMNAGIRPENVIDTLYLSPLLFPKKPYHALLKDDKLQTDELNNPLNDSIKAKDLFNDEVAAFLRLDDEIKRIYFKLIGSTREFKAFFDAFFMNGGPYLRFATKTMADGNDEILKYGKKNYKVGVIVTVQYDALRKALEQQGIINSLTSGFAK